MKSTLNESEDLLISFFWKCIDANQIQGNLVLEGIMITFPQFKCFLLLREHTYYLVKNLNFLQLDTPTNNVIVCNIYQEDITSFSY